MTRPISRDWTRGSAFDWRFRSAPSDYGARNQGALVLKSESAGTAEEPELDEGAIRAVDAPDGDSECSAGGSDAASAEFEDTEFSNAAIDARLGEVDLADLDGPGSTFRKSVEVTSTGDSKGAGSGCSFGAMTGGLGAGATGGVAAVAMAGLLGAGEAGFWMGGLALWGTEEEVFDFARCGIAIFREAGTGAGLGGGPDCRADLQETAGRSSAEVKRRWEMRSIGHWDEGMAGILRTSPQNLGTENGEAGEFP